MLARFKNTVYGLSIELEVEFIILRKLTERREQGLRVAESVLDVW